MHASASKSRYFYACIQTPAIMIKKSVGLLLLAVFLSACAEKIHLQRAERILHREDLTRSGNIRVESYFAGDALDYLVFEVDVFNESTQTLSIDYRNIKLQIFEEGEELLPIIQAALDKNDIIYQLERSHRELEREKKARDIANAVGIGLDLIVIGTSAGFGSVDALLYAADSASFMMEDARAYKLIKGSLEEQISYVEEWVLKRDTLAPGEDNSWDVLFPRELSNGEGRMLIELGDELFIQNYDLSIVTEKVQ